MKLISLIVGTIIYIIIFGILALKTENTEFVFYIGVMIVGIAIISFIHFKNGLNIILLYCLSFWGLLHMMGGMVPVDNNVLYNIWLIPSYLKFDQLVHAYGFGICSWLCWELLKISHYEQTGATLQPCATPLAISLLAGMGLGAFNEVVEFIATLTIQKTNVGSYENTGWDLVFNLIGGIIAVAAIRWRETHHSSRQSSDLPAYKI